MNNVIMKKLIGSKLKELREKKNLSGIELAHSLGCTGSYITRLEKGNIYPSLEMAFRIENVLNLEKRELSALLIQKDFEAAKEGYKEALATPNLEALKINLRKESEEPKEDRIQIPVYLEVSASLKSRLSLRD